MKGGSKTIVGIAVGAFGVAAVAMILRSCTPGRPQEKNGSHLAPDAAAGAEATEGDAVLRLQRHELAPPNAAGIEPDIDRTTEMLAKLPGSGRLPPEEERAMRHSFARTLETYRQVASDHGPASTLRELSSKIHIHYRIRHSEVLLSQIDRGAYAVVPESHSVRSDRDVSYVQYHGAQPIDGEHVKVVIPIVYADDAELLELRERHVEALSAVFAEASGLFNDKGFDERRWLIEDVLAARQQLIDFDGRKFGTNLPIEAQQRLREALEARAHAIDPALRIDRRTYTVMPPEPRPPRRPAPRAR